MFIAPVLIGFVLAAPPAPPAKPPDEGVLLYQWSVKASRAVRQTEFGQMFTAVISGSVMGPGGGWFKPSQGRYNWDWLADRYDLDRDGKITKKEFTGPPELFQRLDRDRDGTITASDMDWADNSAYLRQLGQATQWLVKMDDDGDRRLSKEEWDKLFQKFAQGKAYLNADDVRAMFNPPAPPPPPGQARSPMADMPSKKILLTGLLNGELGSACEGPKIGDEAPDFVLTDLDGKTVSLSQFRGKKPVMIVFGSFT